ncbi:MAG: choice-of-anchor J domain-containing protein [Bacteroidales bacterium]|nr:choice-of-anchor J domain-containing protein [Bacteroidales bacterium]
MTEMYSIDRSGMARACRGASFVPQCDIDYEQTKNTSSMKRFLPNSSGKSQFVNLKSKIVTLLLLLFFTSLAWGQSKTLTVCDGSETNNYVPIYGLYVDTNNQNSEFIIPAETEGTTGELESGTMSDMEGGTITQLAFYITNSPESWGNPTVQVYMGEVDGTTLSSLNGPTNFTTVWTGTLSNENATMEITLSTPYTYEGGNLLIGMYVQSKSSTYKTTTFTGIKPDYSSSSRYNSGSGTGTAQQFLPKTTFTYTPGGATLSWSNPSGGTISVLRNGSALSSGSRVAEGATLDITAAPNSGYLFSGWTVSGTGSSVSNVNSENTTLTMGSGNTTLSASFIAAPPAPTITQSSTNFCTSDVTLTANIGGASVPAGFSFHWYSDAGCTNEISGAFGTNCNQITIAPSADYTNIYCRLEKRTNISTTQVRDNFTVGSVNSYTIPEGTTSLFMQVWGAQGGYRSESKYGGKGGYSEGTWDSPTPGSTLYVVVGGEGNSGSVSNSIYAGGYNGGGYRYGYPGGGGATHIATATGLLKDLSSNTGAVLIVAGGGGSDGGSDRYGYWGGGENGGSGTGSSTETQFGGNHYSYANDYNRCAQGGTQNAAGGGNTITTQATTDLNSNNTNYYGGFGFGGGGVYLSNGYGGAGGGGWYGGSGTVPDGSGDDDRGGGGGSGHVNTDMLSDGSLVAGNESMPTHDGTGTMTGNTGDGFARITATIEYVQVTSCSAGSLAVRCSSCNPANITLSNSSTVNLYVGQSVSPTRTATSSNSSGAISYSSDNSAVSVNSSTGYVTALRGGTATVSATVAQYGTYCSNSASYTVNVQWPTISLNQSSTPLCGEEVTISASISPDVNLANQYEFAWYTTDDFANEHRIDPSLTYGNNGRNLTYTASSGTEIYCRLERTINSELFYSGDASLEINCFECSDPTDLAQSSYSTNSAVLEWVETGDADEWVLQYSTDPDFLSDIHSVEVSGSPTTTLSGLTPEIIYYCRVKSLCIDDEETGWSDVCEATPTICKLVTGSGETTNTYLPSYSYYKYALSQQIYTSVEVGEAGQIKGISLYCALNGSRNFDIYLKHTNKDTFESTTDWISVDQDENPVFSGDVTFTAGTWTKIDFQIPFDYDGTSNLVVIMDDNSGVWGSSPYLNYKVYSATNMALYVYSDGTNYSVTSPSYTGTRPSVKNQIKFCVGPTVTCHNPRSITSNVTQDNLTGVISATITWTGGDSAESEYSIDGGSTWTYINGRQVTLSDLNANTEYTVMVRTYCSSSDKSEYISTVFRTPCGYQVVPYTENFEGVPTGNSGVYEVPSCWDKNVSNGNYPYVAYNTAGNAHSGSKYLYMYPASGADNIVTLPTMIDPINTLQISFWAKSGTDQKEIQLGYVKNGTFTGLAGDKYNFTLTTTYQQFFAYLDDVPADADNIAIRAYYQSASYYVYLDDIEVSLMPTCFTPTDVTASNINTTSATISWTAGRNETAWNLRYRRVGAGSWSYVNNISDVSSCDLSGLTEATHYEVQVRSDCGGDDHSDWASISFTTPYTIPFVENFPTTTIPADWSRYTGLLANVMNGTANLTVTTSGWTGTTSYAFNSSPHFYVYISGTINYWLVTPLVHMESNVELSFDYALRNSSGNAPNTPGSDDKFVVLVSTDNGANWTILRQYINTGDYLYSSLATPGKATISLGSYAGQNVLVAFYGESTSGSEYNYMNIDNVKMAQPCDAPSDLQVSNVTSRSATISWLPGDGSAWQYSYNHSSWYDINSNAITTSGIRKSYNLSLNAGESYTVYLRTNCTIEQSDYVSVSFNTDFCDEGDKCTLSYVLADQNSDGWDGNAYIAVVDHETSRELVQWTIPTDGNNTASARGSYSVCDYRYVDFVWHKGSYDRECSFYIYNADGVLILSASTNVANNYTDNQVLLSYQMNCPSCLRPTNLSVSKVTNSSARLTWAPGGSEEHWRYSIDGTNWITFADGDITVSGSNRMATISGLSAGETYTVYLQAVCGGEDYSASSIVEFSTLTCLPYETCDISYTLTDSYGDTWNGNAIQIVDVGTDKVLTTLTNDYDACSALSRCGESYTQEGSFSVCEDSPIKFVWVEGGYANEVSYEFSDASGVFYSVATSGASSFADGDELEISDGVYEYTVVCPNCRRPVNLEASNITDNSATIGWVRDADSYNVNYGMVYNFDDGTPQGWTTIDDGDPFGYGWGVASARNASIVGRNSSDCMVSQSNDDNYGSITPDNYLVSPRITFGDGASISFYAKGLDSYNSEEHFEVVFSTTGNSGFTSVSGTLEATYDWALYTVDLSAYSGQQGYVAIHHFDCNGLYWLAVDDIAITEKVSVTTNPYTLTGLTPSTGYMVSVQLACEEDEYSTWSDAEEFTTSAPPYAAQWVSAEMNTSDWCSGDTRDVTLRIKNTGPTTWKKTSTGGDNTSTPTDHDVIAVSYKWEGDLDYSTTYAEFTSDVVSGQIGTINLSVNKPTRAGLNRLLFNIKRMNIGWFSDFNYAVEKVVTINAPIPSLALGNTDDLASCLTGSKQIKIIATQQSGSFFEEFETGMTNWTTSYSVSSNYRWLQREGTELGSHTSAYSGSYNAAAAYNGNVASYAYMQLNKDLSSYTDKVMSFWYKNPYGSTYSNYDYLFVETSTNGSSWTQLASYTDYHNSWTHVTNLAIPDNVKFIRFSAYIRGANFGRGVAIDDVSITYTDNSSSAFTWIPSSGSTAGSVDPYHGNIYVVTPSALHNTYTASAGGCSSSITVDVMPALDNAPTVSVTDYLTGSTTVDCGAQAVLTASNAADASAFYNWYNGDGLLQSNLAGVYTTVEALDNDTTFFVDASFNGLFNTIVYDAAGSYLLTIPEGVTSVLIEAWGAQGGGSHEDGTLYPDRGGRGGYSKGTYTVSGTGNEALYICVGGRGTNGVETESSSGNVDNAEGGLNGGGNGARDDEDTGDGQESGGGGGGATHVAIGLPTMNQSGEQYPNSNRKYELQYYYNNQSDILLVAGGGGGSSCQAPGGAGGGTAGCHAYAGVDPNAWTTTSGGGIGGSASNNSGTFGKGENAGTSFKYKNGVGGGGGGYYGGKINATDDSGRQNSGGGGSGYLNSSKLTDTQTIDGEHEMPNPMGGYMVGKKGDGYVKITLYGTQVCKSAQRTVEVAVNKPSLTMGSISSETVCAGTPFTALDITPSSNNGSLTYTWQKDSGDPYIGTSTISTPTAGVYNVTVTSNINACEVTATASATLTLNTPSVGTLSFTENKTVCPGSEVTLKVTSETSPTGTLEYRWYKDNVEMGGETDNHISTREAGTYKVSVMVTNTIGTVTCPASQVHDNIEVSYLTPSDPDITAMNIGGSIPSGSVLWTGQGTNWNDDYNWMSYDGSTYTLTATPNGSNALIGKYSTCVTGSPTLNVNTTANVNNLTIASGTTLKVPANKILNIAGNLNNVGTLSAYNALDDTGGTVVFNGNSNQTISNAVTFMDVEFAQTGVGVDTIKAADEITVNGTATFTKGIVKANMLFDSGASSADASMNSYVDGTVTKNGDGNSFTFPTGSDGVLGTITATIRSGQNAVAKFHHKTGGFSQEDGYPRWWNVADMCDQGSARFYHISNYEYWDFNTSEALTGVTFISKASSAAAHFGDPATLPEPDQFDSGAMQVAVYNGRCWENSGGSLSIQDEKCTIVISGVGTSRSPVRSGALITSFGSKDPAIVLPIELLSFTATCNGRYAELEWTTASERNNDYFVIERSDDALNFIEVGRVAGAGNSIEQLDYTYNDYGIHGGDNYYRLVQVDYDGTRTASEIVVANCADVVVEDPEVMAYPNPFNGELTIILDNFDNRPATIEVYDMLGKLVFVEKAVSPQNSYETVLNLSNLPTGAYNVRVSTSDFVINKQVVKN